MPVVVSLLQVRIAMTGTNNMVYTKLLGVARQPLDILYIPGILAFPASSEVSTIERCRSADPLVLEMFLPRMQTAITPNVARIYVSLAADHG